MVFDRLFRKTPTEVGLKIMPKGVELRVSTHETVLQSALGQGLAFPHNCRVGGCGECKCRLIEGKVKELTDKSYLLSAEELRGNFILACQSIPKSDVVVEVTLSTAPTVHPIVQTRARVAAIEALTHDIVHLTLTLDQPLVYTAGQYAELVIPEAAGAQAGRPRSYSFASAPSSQPTASTVDFFVRKVEGGAFTEWLFAQGRPGCELELRGPYGDFYLRPGDRPLLCIAGGSGLAPIRAMLQQAVAEGRTHRDLVFVFGARTQSDLYGSADLEHVARAWQGRFQSVPVLSSEPADSAWGGRRGLIPPLMGELVTQELAAHDVYLCGPPAMIDACLEVLAARGVSAEHIHFDKFLDSGHTAVGTSGSTE